MIPPDKSVCVVETGNNQLEKLFIKLRSEIFEIKAKIK